MVEKQWRQLTISTTHLAQELLINIQCSGDSRNFAKERRDLKMRSTVTGHQKLTMANWAIIKADPLTTTRGVAEEFNVSHSTLIWYLKQIGKVKKLISGCLMSWQNCHFEVSSSLILHNNNEPFLDWIVTCDEKWILYDNQQCPPQWSNLEKAPKHLPKPNFHQKKKEKDHGHCLVVCCQSDPL